MSTTVARIKPGRYDHLRLLAYVPRRGKDFPKQMIWSTEFPKTWVQRLEALETQCRLTHKRPNKSKYINLPLASVNNVLPLVFPALLTPGFKFQRPILSTLDLNEYLPGLTNIIQAWVGYEYDRKIERGSNATSEALEMLRDTQAWLSPNHLKILMHEVDPGCPELNPVKDSKPIDHLYFKATPLFLVSLVEGKSIEVGGEMYTFRRCQSTDREGVELMTWPPMPFDDWPRSRPPGYMSLVLEFHVHTVPYVELPIIFPKFHVRRWVHQPLQTEDGEYLFLPYNTDSTVYITTEVPWLEGTPRMQGSSAMFSVAKLGVSSGFTAVWTDDLMEMLERIGARSIPTSNAVVQQPLQVSSDLEYGVVMSTAILKHMRSSYPIGTGLFPRDWQMLSEQVQEWVTPWLEPLVNDLPLTHKLPSFSSNRKGLSSDQIGKSVTKSILPRRRINLECMYIDPVTARMCWRAVKLHFGIVSANINDEEIFGGGVLTTLHNELEIFFRAQVNEFLELDIQSTGKDAFATGIEKLRLQIEGANLPGWPSDMVTLTIMELEDLSKGKKAERIRDAKLPNRFLLTHKNRLSQFLVPEKFTAAKMGKYETERKVPDRIGSAMLDVRRQLGFVGDEISKWLTDDLKLEPGTQLIGLHLEQHYRLGVHQNSSPVKFPVAARLVVGEQHVEALIPSRSTPILEVDWKHYIDAQLEMGSYSGEQLNWKDEDIQKFLLRLLDLVENSKAILFVPAVPWRSKKIWPWLQNQLYTSDHMSLGTRVYYPSGASVPFGKQQAKGLRIVRYRYDAETPAYLAIDKRQPLSEQSGYGNGVWSLPGTNNRVFFSVARKPDTYQPSYAWSRFNKGYREPARMPQLAEVIPVFLQPEDDPYDFVKIFHYLRVPPHWKQGMTEAPLPVHLAKTAAQDYLGMQYRFD